MRVVTLEQFMKLIEEVEGALVEIMTVKAPVRQVTKPVNHPRQTEQCEKKVVESKKPVVQRDLRTTKASIPAPVQGVGAMRLPDIVKFNEPQRTTTLVWFESMPKPVIVQVKAMASDKYDRRIGFLEAWFQATQLHWDKLQCNEYLARLEN